MSIINLTPHPIRIYGGSVPDRFNPGDHDPIRVLEPATDIPTARIGQIDLGTFYIHGIPVEYVEFTSHGGLQNPIPEPVDGVYYVVSLVVAIQQTYAMNRRADLLVPYREVRNNEGTVIGCRELAMPV